MYHFRDTVTCTLISDLVFRIIVSGAHLLYNLIIFKVTGGHKLPNLSQILLVCTIFPELLDERPPSYNSFDCG